jgi:hypothetical protein
MKRTTLAIILMAICWAGSGWADPTPTPTATPTATPTPAYHWPIQQTREIRLAGDAQSTSISLKRHGDNFSFGGGIEINDTPVIGEDRASTFTQMATTGDARIGGSLYVGGNPIWTMPAGTTTNTLLRWTGAAWAASTAKYLDTMTTYGLLYASAQNQMGQITVVPKAVLVTDAAGVPTLSTDLDTSNTIGGQRIYRAGDSIETLSNAGTMYLQDADAVNITGGNATLNYLAVTTSSLTPVSFSSTDAGATGAIVELYRNSASPATSDVLMPFYFYGKNFSGIKQLYASIVPSIGSTTAPVSGVLKFNVMSAATDTTFLTISGGAVPMIGFTGAPIYINGLPFVDIYRNLTALTVSAGSIAAAGHINSSGGGIRTGGVERISYAGNWTGNSITQAKGGLAADVSAFSGLLKMNNGSAPTTITDGSADWNTAYSKWTTLDALNGIIAGDGAGNYSVATSIASADNATTATWATNAEHALAADSATTCPAAALATTTVNGHALTGPVTVTPTDLSLVIGTNTEAWDADLDALAGLTSATDTLAYFTGSHTAALTPFTAFGRALVDEATTTTARAALGLVIGTDVQAQGNYVTALTGDVTASGPGSVAATIANNAVTNAKAAQMAATTLKGNSTGATANASDLSTPTVRTMLGINNVVNLDTSNPANITQSASYRFVTDTEKGTWNGKQAAYANLTTIGGLANGAGWLHNDGAGAFAYSTPSKTDVGLSNVTNNAQYYSGGTDVAVADGGTGASDASTARTNLGVAIGSNVQAYNSYLTGINQALDTTASPVHVSPNATTGINTGAGAGTQRIDANGTATLGTIIMTAGNALKPSADSTTAVKIANAAGTPIVTVNTTSPGVTIAGNTDIGTDGGGDVIFNVYSGTSGRRFTLTNGAFSVNGTTVFDYNRLIRAGGNEANPGLGFSADTNTGLYAVGGDVLGFSAGGTGRVFVSPTGFGVGIQPAVKLHLDGGNATAVYEKFTAGTTTGVTATDGFDVGVDGSGNAEIRQRENLPLYIYTNNTLAATVAAAGGITAASTLSAAGITASGTTNINANNGDLQTSGTTRINKSGAGTLASLVNGTLTLPNSTLTSGSLLMGQNTSAPIVLAPNVANGWAKLDSAGNFAVAGIIPRYDTAANINGITLAQGELATTSDTQELRRGDGATAGGVGITNLGKIINYAGVATAGYGVPAIVDYQSYTAKTASITLTMVANTTTAGLYRVNYYLFVTTADAGSTATVTAGVVNNDGTSSKVFASSAINCNTAYDYQQGSVICLQTSGYMSVGASLSGTIGSAQYAFYWTCERLN